MPKKEMYGLPCKHTKTSWLSPPLKEIAAIILVKGHLPEEDTLEESNNENIPILSSPLQTFEITGQLYKLLHP